MIILIGPSASGKTEVAKYLMSHFGIKKVITHTTRPMRVNEVNGRDYHFVSKDKFEYLKKQDYFVETTFYNGNYYGTSKKEVADDKCLIVDPSGLKAFLNLNDSRIVTFGLKASEETRINRMKERKDHTELITKRIENDRIIFIDSIYDLLNYTYNSEQYTIEELAAKISNAYKTHLK